MSDYFKVEIKVTSDEKELTDFINEQNDKGYAIESISAVYPNYIDRKLIYTLLFKKRGGF
jgi:hypothetical protein